MFKLLTILIFFIINVTLAQLDSHRIFKRKWIKHGVNGAFYTLIVLIPFYFFRDYWLMALLFVERLLVFNISLSLFRKLKWYYISPERKPITDRIAFSIFGYKGKLMYACYLVVFILLTCKAFR